MWKRSFVATTVALGDTVDDALASMLSSSRSADSTPTSTVFDSSPPDLGVAVAELVNQLGAPQRATRAAALAKAVRDIVLAIDEGSLR